ncbi:DNA-binding transcriptional LysR family regulator [Catenuloplanes nepalensis]|uniref:DNA-binding transcriptional LysR family regulator n=1 Tax=Catenuloplanes nepalensis TaxID=587533 RepID=A0ABT9MRL2_9ACTN|nr:LysR family transcriptional regulator [Catenuloplanes nepalensis]MDP9793908.1 DNA-binding transcriptional LysR family regulator [Catenuloplanes nepalensis]
MDDLETRELRYFVAVAEELHFGRAADRLGIAQPPLSRAIRRLEHRLGVPLLERTSRSARLTPAGEVLLSEGRAALAAVAAATRRTRRAGRPAPGLVLALKAGGDSGLLPAILGGYAAQPGSVPVELIFSIGERAAMVRDGRADLALLHHPQNDLTGLDSEPLHTERRVLALAGNHPLAARDSLTLADLAGLPVPRWPEAAIAAPGPPIAEVGELLQLIVLGRVVSLVTESAAARPHPGVAYRPVLDAPPTTLVLAWPANSRSRTVAAFVTAARTAAGEAGPVPVREP